MDVPRRGATKDGHHPRKSTRPRKAAILDGAGGAQDEGRAQDSANDTEGGTMEGQDENRGDVGIEEGGETVPDSKVNALERVNAMDSETTEKKLWELQRFLNNRKESPSSRCEHQSV